MRCRWFKTVDGMSSSGWFAGRVPWSREALCWVSKSELIHSKFRRLLTVRAKGTSSTCTSDKGFGKPKSKKVGKAAENPAKHVKTGKTSSSKCFGPRPQGMLLVGFTEDDFEAVRSWFSAIEPGFRISCCSDELLGLSLEGAVTAPDGSFCRCRGWQQPRELVPRAAVFSGLNGEEAVGIAQFWESSGIKTPIFTSVVEAAKAKPLRAVLLEVAQAYAASSAHPEETLNAESLRALLRERIAAKSGRSPGGALKRGPIVINADGTSIS